MTELVSKPKRGRPKNSGYRIEPATVAALQAQGLSYKQIGEQLGIAKNTIGILLTRHRRETVSTTNADRLQRFVDAVKSGNTRALGLLDQWEPCDVSAIVLDRTGQSPIRFSGRLLREGSTRQFAASPDDTRDWWDIKIFEVTSVDDSPLSAYAVSIEYSTIIKTATHSQQIAIFTDDPAGTIVGYDPLAVLRGYPPAPQYASRQAFLETTSKLQYGKLVSQLLRDPL